MGNSIRDLKKLGGAIRLMPNGFYKAFLKTKAAYGHTATIAAFKLLEYLD